MTIKTVLHNLLIDIQFVVVATLIFLTSISMASNIVDVAQLSFATYQSIALVLSVAITTATVFAVSFIKNHRANKG